MKNRGLHTAQSGSAVELRLMLYEFESRLSLLGILPSQLVVIRSRWLGSKCCSNAVINSEGNITLVIRTYCRVTAGHMSNGVLDVLLLLLRNCWMESRLFKGEGKPEHCPDDTGNA